MSPRIRIHALAALASVSAACLISLPAQAQTVIKIGAIAPKTGPLAGGAAVTHWPNVQLWAANVNKQGGLMLKAAGRRVPVEIIEIDDRTNNEDAVKGVERLVNQDKVDFIIAPYGTGANLAVAPLLNRYGFPHIAVSAISDKGPEFVARWPNSFWLLGTSTGFASGAVEALNRLKSEGKIGNKVAMVNVADAFGIELATAGRKAFKDAGFELVYDKSYPLGTQDLSPVINEAKRANPDAFVAFSYPPDTFALTDAGKVAGFNPKAWYTGVATAFPGFGGRFGAGTEGVLGAGGVNQESPQMQAYFKNHLEVTGKPADNWASAVTYASLEMMGQAIERVGLDRAAVIKEIQGGEFDTVIGKIKLKGNLNENFWSVGQWQGGKFVGVAPTRMSGAKAPIVKPEWK